jgi:hypothetical protein
MKIHNKVVVSLVTLMLAGCASTSKEEPKSASKAESTPQATNQESRGESARAVLEFKRLGLRLIHSPMGQIEAIEATGYAPVWSASQNAIREANRVAELEAKKIINDFINDETITSGVTVTMISRNIEKAVDRKNVTNLERDASVSALTTDQEVDVPLTSAGGTNSVGSNRSDAVKIASELKTTITANNKGILGGLYLVNSEVVDGGKSVRATYRWDRRGAQDRREIRDLMRK